MSHTSGVNTIDVVVRKALAYSKVPESEYMIWYQICLDGIRDLYDGVLRGATTIVKVQPNAINRIPFPSDMIDFIGLGVPLAGRVWVLTEDNKIITTYSENEEGLYLDAESGEGVELQRAQFEGLKATGGVNTKGYFVIDWENQVIIVNDDGTRSEYLLHYQRSGIDLTNGTFVPVRAITALVSYINWNYIKHDRRVPIGERRNAEANYRADKLELKKKEMFSSGVTSFWDVWSKSNNLLRR